MTPHRTPDEQRVLNKMREARGDEYVEENMERILTQVRLVGEL